MKETKIQTQSSADRITSSLSLAYQRKNKQTKTQHKSHPIRSLHTHTHTHKTKLTQTTGPTLGRQKPKGRKNSTLKPGKRRPQTQLVKKIMKRKRNSIQMKEQTRNTEIQVNEEEIGKLPEKEFRIMIVKMIKKILKTKWRKCKNQLTKT